MKKYSQYTNDISEKLNFPFESGKRLLDVGCGGGFDSEVLINKYKLNVNGVDIYKDNNIDKIKGLKFSIASVYSLPFEDSTFDYVFLHDVLHHIDEEHQSYDNHVKALMELKRVCKKGGVIIIVEANRYNFLFYPHMVKMMGHNHWKQGYFKRLLLVMFGDVTFRYFEAHSYPPRYMVFWKLYERIIESVSPKMFLAYNVAIIKI